MNNRNLKPGPEDTQNLTNYTNLMYEALAVPVQAREISDFLNSRDQLTTVDQIRQYVAVLPLMIRLLSAIKIFLDEFPAKKQVLLEKLSPKERIGLTLIKKQCAFERGEGVEKNDAREKVSLKFFAAYAPEKRSEELETECMKRKM